MTYCLYSFIFICLNVYLGIGLTLILVPEKLRKFTIFLSPLVGYCYLTLLGWYFYRFDFKGTDSYAWILLLPPSLFLYFGYQRLKRQKAALSSLWQREFLLPLSAGILSFLVFSFPFFMNNKNLTAMSLGNLDIAQYSSISAYLKEFSLSDGAGETPYSFILSGVNSYNADEKPLLNCFKFYAERSVFGPFLLSACTSSLFDLDTYQVQNMIVAVFFLFSTLIVYVLARSTFEYNPFSALIITLLFGLSPIIFYIAYNGFQSQLVSTGVMLCIFLLSAQSIKECIRGRDYLPYVPLAVLLNWGLSITYPHMLLLIYGPLVFYLIMLSFFKKTIRPILNYGSFFILFTIITFLISPYRAKVVWQYFVFMGKIPVEWWHMPFLFPNEIFGVMNRLLDIPHGFSYLYLIASSLLVLMLCYGFFKAYQSESKYALFAISILFTLLLGYVILSYPGKSPLGWGGYKSFKFISFFLPLIFLSSLIGLRNLDSSSKLQGLLYHSFPMIFLVGGSCFSAYRLTQKMYNGALTVTAEMADLRKLESDVSIESINIRATDYWKGVWEVYFLYKKKLYPELAMYWFSPPPLQGQWDLVQTPSEPINVDKENSRNVIPVNSSYVLMKPRPSTLDFILPDTACKATLILLRDDKNIIVNRKHPLTLPIKIQNISNATWPSGGLKRKNPVNLAYHLYDKHGKLINYDGARTAIPIELNPNETFAVHAVVNVPDKPGKYYLEFDVIQEGIAWFKDKGSQSLTIPISIK